MRSRAFAALAALSLLACLPQSRPTGPDRANSMYVLDLNGQVSLTKSGGVRLDLDGNNCTRYVDVPHPYGGVQTAQESCVPFGEDEAWRSMHVRTPWGQEVTAARGGPYWCEFAIDWSQAGMDPFAARADELAARPWRFDSPHAADPLSWQPDADAAQEILGFVGQAIGVETVVAEVNAPARLTVTETRFTAEVRNGAGADLIVTVKNDGDGDAYQVVATLRSTVEVLHAQRLGFGRIAAGTAKTRRLHVELPRDNPESEAVVVLSFSEAHGYGAPQATLRAPILRPADVGSLSLRCSVDGANGARVKVDAGQTIQVSCEIAVAGASARGLRVAAQLGGVSVPASGAFDLAKGATKTVGMPVTVPDTATMDAELPLAVVARDELGAAESATFTLVVVRTKVCPNGKLTLKDVRARTAEYRKLEADGVLTEAERKSYEAQLVSCMSVDR
jgi:hypothetical protein